MLPSDESVRALTNSVANLLQFDLVAFAAGDLTGHLTAIVSEIHGFVLLGCVTEAVFIEFVLAEMAAKMTI